MDGIRFVGSPVILIAFFVVVWILAKFNFTRRQKARLKRWFAVRKERGKAGNLYLRGMNGNWYPLGKKAILTGKATRLITDGIKAEAKFRLVEPDPDVRLRSTQCIAFFQYVEAEDLPVGSLPILSVKAKFVDQPHIFSTELPTSEDFARIEEQVRV